MALEVYILSPERSARMATSFLDAVMPQRAVAAEEFPFPEFADKPDVVLASPEEAIVRLDSFPREPYSLYWNNAVAGEPFGCILTYTEDQALILGVAVSDANAISWLTRLASLVDGKFGYVTGEEAPPDSKKELIERSRLSKIARIVDGNAEGC